MFSLLFDVAGVAFVMGPPGPRKSLAPGPVPRPGPLTGQGWGPFSGLPCPVTCLGNCPAHDLDGPPSNLAGEKHVPSRERLVSGHGRGRGEENVQNTPPGLCNGGAPPCETRPALPRNEH